MADKDKYADELLSDDELDNVAGGTKQEFNDICRCLGRDPRFSSRVQIREILNENYGIGVGDWNTGERGSTKVAPAEFYISGTDKKLSFDQVMNVIGGYIKISEL